VVAAARRALQQANVARVLPYVPQSAEAEVRAAYEKVMPLRHDGTAAREVAELFFFETVVRLHRMGEGAPYTGLKPAGLDVGPVIPVAEKTCETGRPEALISVLRDVVTAEVHARLARLAELKAHAGESVDAEREYVEAMLGLQVWSHQVYLAATGMAHEGEHHHG
jgi:hypothetical protein